MPIDQHALNQIEAVLFASEAPVTRAVLQQLFEPALTPSQLSDWLTALAARYEQTALELVETASGWRIQVRAIHAPMLSRLWPERPLRLSQALLEILTVIAYRQPVTRGDIEQMRGVAVNSQILRTLFERQWITERGYREVAGKPALLVTTRQFLDAFGLRSLAELPPLGDTVQHLLTPSGSTAGFGHCERAQQDLKQR
jgi:segregation and condensation protein B